MVQPRIQIGLQSQDRAHAFLYEAYNDDFALISKATHSSTAPDLIANIHGIQTQFEIKSRSSASSSVKLYESRLKRGDKNSIFNTFIKAYTDNNFNNLEDYIDDQRINNSKYGFPGEYGVEASGGKFYISSTNKKLISLIRRRVIAQMHAAADDYFVLHTRDTDTIHIYNTKSKNNHIKAPRIPNIRRVELSTYGTVGVGILRLALKVNFTK